ncbi:hypothetical protein PDJAM_G00212670 [Pangasius djambal]|uniref:Uncharacterized protein n=1 Tax=Pangasius djambal TaxID=1691987 RepID=A0ACC5YC34_9TELE|nr:hypothetical protein [Pangasius djambal]
MAVGICPLSHKSISEVRDKRRELIPIPTSATDVPRALAYTMPSTINRKSYPPEADKSKSSVVEDSKKKTSLLKDNSWIKKDVNDDKVVDQNSNFGRSVLSRFRSSENLSSSSEKGTSTSTSTSSTATATGPSRKNVQSLTKRFSASQDELDSSSTTTTTSFNNGTKTTVTTSRTSVKSPTKTETFTEKIVTDSKTNTGKIQTQPPTPVETTTKSVTKSETVTVTTSKDNTVQEDIKTVKPATPLSPTKTTKTETVTVITSKDNTVQKDNKTAKSVTTPLSPTKTTKTETVTVITSKDNTVQEDNKTVKSVTTPLSPSKTTKTETVTVTTFKDTIVQEDSKSAKSALPASPTKSITGTTYTSTTPTSKTESYTFSSKSSAEDQLFDTLIPTSIKSARGSDRPEEYTSETKVTESMKTYSSMSDSYEYSPRRGSTKTYTTTTYTESRPEDLSDIYRSRTVETVYTSPERKIIERDLCTYCQKPMLSDTKMILEDVDIKCHASCFRCDVCKSPLGHLKAGDSMWLYRRTVHCEACFGITKGKWLH